MIELDEKVIEMAANGDERSFEKIVIESQSYIWSYALRFLGDYHIAQDAVQEIYIKIYKGLKGFNSRSKFTTWLYTVTHNSCIDLYRKHIKANQAFILEENKSIEKRSSDYSDSYLSEMLDKLRPELRQTFAMVAIFGFSYKEVSKQLDCTINTVKVRIYRARQELIKMIQVNNIEEVEK